MKPEQIKQEQERVNKLLEGITPGEWEVVGETTVWIGEDDFFWVHAEKDAALIAAAPDIARAYLALLDAHLALHAQLAQAGEREKRLREVMDEHFPEWDDDRDQHAFEECMWQSDSAHAAALPAICAIRAALAQAGEG